MPEQMCYRQDFLTMVLLRVDFPPTVLGTEERNAFAVKIAEKYPHVSSNPLREVMFSVTEAGGDLTHRDLGTQLTYRKSVAGTITLVITQDSMTLSYGPSDYSGFAPFLEEFSFALNAAADAFKIHQFTRIGLRYINEIRLQGRALEWGGVIEDGLLAAVLTPALAGGRLQRSMHQVSEIHDDDQLLMNYGLVNPDYPAPLIQRHFVLDIDCSRQSVVNFSETIDCVKKLNALGSATFERSIGEELRKIMGVNRV